MYFRISIVKYLHKLFDHAVGAQLICVDLIGAKVSHQPKYGLDTWPRARLYGHELSDYAETVYRADLFLREQHVRVTVGNVA